jgi:hypothetical protein
LQKFKLCFFSSSYQDQPQIYKYPAPLFMHVCEQCVKWPLALCLLIHRQEATGWACHYSETVTILLIYVIDELSEHSSSCEDCQMLLKLGHDNINNMTCGRQCSAALLAIFLLTDKELRDSSVVGPFTCGSEDNSVRSVRFLPSPYPPYGLCRPSSFLSNRYGWGDKGKGSDTSTAPMYFLA